MCLSGTEQTDFSTAAFWSDTFILGMTTFPSSREAWELLYLEKITCFEELMLNFLCLKEYLNP